MEADVYEFVGLLPIMIIIGIVAVFVLKAIG